MTDKSYSVFNAMVEIVASPGKALDEIKSHTSWLWWPLLITMLLASGLMVYFGIVPAAKAAQLNPIDALRYE